MARYIKFVDALNKVVRVILVGMFIMMFLTAFLQVIIRNMTTGSIPWSDELCRYLIIFIVWLGAGLAARSNRLIRMEVLPSLTKMSDRNLHIMYWISTIISLGFAVLTVKAKLFCPEIAGLFCRIAGLFCHDSRANLSLKPVCFGIAIS